MWGSVRTGATKPKFARPETELIALEQKLALFPAAFNTPNWRTQPHFGIAEIHRSLRLP